jgi:hypothetical protein
MGDYKMSMPRTEKNFSICISCNDCIRGRGCRYLRKKITLKIRQSKVVKDGLRKCAMCGEWQPLNMFSKNPNMKYGGVNAYCKPCFRKYNRGPYTENQKEYQRRYYKKNIDEIKEYKAKWGENNIVKVRASSKVHSALKKGILSKPDQCERCGMAGGLHAHHPDYSQPLKVEWLCGSCHGIEHRGVK